MIKKLACKTPMKRIRPVNPVRNSRKASKPDGIIPKSIPTKGRTGEPGALISNGINHFHHRKIRSLLDGIPEDIPSLLRANLITQRVSRAGFDWPDLKGVLSKMEEEIQEVQQALLSGDKKKIREEIGDLLFVLTNLARFLKIDPEDALRRTIEKFISRFMYIEVSLLKKGKTIHQSNLIEMDSLWEEAKQKRRRK